MMRLLGKLGLAIFSAALAALPVPARDYGLTQRPTVGAYLDGVLPPQPPVVGTNWSTVLAFPNLTFSNPLGITQMPGQPLMVVWEREGRIYSFPKNSATSTKTLIADFQPVCQGWDDSGMLGIAFHPKFSLSGAAGTNRYVFLWYNHTRPGMQVQGNATARPSADLDTVNRLSRITLDANGVMVPNSETVFIDQNDSSVWHNGGGMFFHPDNGFLYITNGDDNNGANNQTITNSLFSCVIRIDVDKIGGSISHQAPRVPTGATTPSSPANALYYIPNDNPFVGVANANEEIYALGLRSPHRMTIDPITKRIFIGDVGQGDREEVSIIEPTDPPGLNFQWNRIEGLNGDLTAPYIGVNKRPVIDYTHGEGNAVIGGYVYRGPEFPELAGKYFFADNGRGTIWYLNETTTPATKVVLTTLPDAAGTPSGSGYTGLSSFGTDSAGELYICRMSNADGRIFKLQRGGAASQPLPSTLSAAGVFSNLPALTPSDKLVPYALIQPFWSDRAVKTRWAAVPSNTTVGFAPTGEWTWPAGSVFVKHFELPVDDNDPSVRRRLETRLLVKTNTGATYGATYKWRADNSNADLLSTSLTENVPITITPLGTLTGQDIGAPAQAGSTSRANNLVTIQAGGVDIYGTADQFHFASQQRTGDFDISVRVESLIAPDLYTKAGLMVRESLAANSRNLMALVFPNNNARNNNNGGYEFQYRPITGGPSAAIYPALPQPTVAYPNAWLRLRREGSTFLAFSSLDGAVWKEYARLTLDLPTTVYFGLAVTSHSGTTPTTAKIHVQSTRLQPWYYPSPTDCTTCHTAAAGGVLGPKTRQLNGNLLYPNGVTDNQLRAWAHAGFFDQPPPEASLPNLDRLATLNDPSASLEKRARSYLDSNCASCHRPGGAHAFWDARYDTPLAQQGLLYGILGSDLGDPLARVIVPQETEHSVLYRRISTVGPIQMPPLARSLNDQAGIDLLAQWINSLTPNTPPTVSMTGPGVGAFFAFNQTIPLRATASDTDGIQKVDFYDGDRKIGEDTTAPYEWTWIGAPPGPRLVRAAATDRVGNSNLSAPITVTVENPPLPSPWKSDDVGDIGVFGQAGFNGGTFSLSGSGVDVWGNADSFHMVYRPLIGDGEIIARVTAQENTDAWAKAGVMMRENLSAGSRHASMLITPGNGSSFQRRLTTGGASASTAGPAATVPYWVRLVRTGSSFSGYISSNGTTWNLVATDQLALPLTIYVGLAVSSHNNGTSSEATFTNVALNAASTFSTSINFQPAAAAVPAGYLVDSGAAYSARGNGFSYGWNQDNASTAADRNSANAPDQRYDTNLATSTTTNRTWEIAVPNALYNVRIVAGDATLTGAQNVKAENVTVINGTTTTGQRFIDSTATVTVTDGRLTISPGSASTAWICFIEITSTSAAANVLPVVELTSPAAGASFYDPSSVTLTATASDPDNAITRVEFFVDDLKIGEDTSAPFSFAWTAPAFGTHVATARAVNDAGGTVTSTPIDVNVIKPNLAGFRGEYFKNADLTGLVFVRADATVNFNWGAGSPDPRIAVNSFSVRWSGRIRPLYSQNYTFATTTNDGVRLWVNGQLLIDEWSNQTSVRHTGSIPLVANQDYDLVMEYYDGAGDASALLTWSSQSQAEQNIPSNRSTVPVAINESPLVSLTAPGAGALSLPGDTLTLSAGAADGDGSIARVEFWADGLKLGEDTGAPYSWLWNGPRTTGLHSVSAVAVDNLGTSTTSSSVTIETMPMVLKPAATQRLTDPERIAITLRFTLPAGRTYLVEWSPNLTEWYPLQTGTSTGAQIEIIDTSSDLTKRFYRMKPTN